MHRLSETVGSPQMQARGEKVIPIFLYILGVAMLSYFVILAVSPAPFGEYHIIRVAIDIQLG